MSHTIEFDVKHCLHVVGEDIKLSFNHVTFENGTMVLVKNFVTPRAGMGPPHWGSIDPKEDHQKKFEDMKCGYTFTPTNDDIGMNEIVLFGYEGGVVQHRTRPFEVIAKRA